jgi:outer membrane protein TolC
MLKAKRICISTLLVSFCLLLNPQPISFADAKGEVIQEVAPKEIVAAKEATSRPVISKTSSKEIKQKLNALRNEQRRKFRQLTRGFIKEIIREDTLIHKERFLRAGKRSLQEATERALQEDPAVQVAKEKRRLAKLKTLSAFRDLFAAVVFDFEFREGSLSRDAFRGEDYGVRFTQPVYRGGNLWGRFREERANLHAAEEDYDKTLQETTLQVTKAYIEVLRTLNAVQGRKILLDKIGEMRTLSRKKYDRDLISEIEFLNVESMATQSAHDYEASREEAALAQLELQKHVNLEPNEAIELEPLYTYADLLKEAAKEAKKGKKRKENSPTEPISVESELKSDLEHYMGLAYENRPDLKAEAYRLRSEIMGEKATKGKLRPQFDILLEVGELQDVFADQVKGRFHNPEFEVKAEVSWNLGGNTVKYSFNHDKNAPSVSQFLAGTGTDTTRNTFSMALLDNLKDVYAVTEARVALKEQFQKLEDKERDMLREVKEAYFKYHRAKIQLSAVMKRILYRERLVELSKVKLDKNEIQISEYLQSELDLEKEKGEFYSAISEYYKSKAALNRAVGIPDLLRLEKWEG